MKQVKCIQFRSSIDHIKVDTSWCHEKLKSLKIFDNLSIWTRSLWRVTLARSLCLTVIKFERKEALYATDY